jgi:hypothetical protein
MLLDMRIRQAIYFLAAIGLSLSSGAGSLAQTTKDAVVLP